MVEKNVKIRDQISKDSGGSGTSSDETMKDLEENLDSEVSFKAAEADEDK